LPITDPKRIQALERDGAFGAEPNGRKIPQGGKTMIPVVMPMLALLTGSEMLWLVAVVLLLFGSWQLGLGERLREWLKGGDREAHEVGRNFGGIYGKHSAQALTPDNQTAELYDPAAFHRKERISQVTKQTLIRRWLRWCSVSKRPRATE
jgi:hypothetical protein